MKVSASKILNELNHTKIVFNRKNKYTDLAVPKQFLLNRQTIKNMTCNTQIVTIIIGFISMYFSINIYDSKTFYLYKDKNLTYLIYDDNRFDKK